MQHVSVPPAHITLALARTSKLRYGENPHLEAARYAQAGGRSFWDDVNQLAGIELSYQNVVDVEAAWRLVHALPGRSAATIVKHGTPCGAAVAATALKAYEGACTGDPEAAFGGVLAVRGPVSYGIATRIAARPKCDVVVASAFASQAVEAIAGQHRRARLLTAPPPPNGHWVVRQVFDGYLVQERDRVDG